MELRDRRAQLVLPSATLNGIDFVAIGNAAQTLLQVHFINAVSVQQSFIGATITGGETIPTVAILPTVAGDWGWDDGHAVLTLRVAAPGDFSNYVLSINSPALDSWFSTAAFSFKAGCPSDLDCQPPAPVCPPPAGATPPIDYLAKDFLSFRQALLDFSTLSYPAWQERSEADFGMMFLEALSAVADDLSYGQDRVALESSLLTATQMRSAVRHARLVDYPALPATGAKTMLQFNVGQGVSSIPMKVAVTASGPDGTPVTFETGLGLNDTTPAPPASPLWNRAAPGQGIQAYWFDDSAACLAIGATSMYVAGWGYGFVAGQAILIETPAAEPAEPPLRQIVTLTQAGLETDPDGRPLVDAVFPITAVAGGPPYLTPPGSVLGDPAPAAVTRLVWGDADQLLHARDLTQTQVIGNLCAASQGRTTQETFIIGPPPAGQANQVHSAMERLGARPLLSPGRCGTPPTIRLYTLGQAPLTWFPQPSLDPSGDPVAEIKLSQASASGGDPVSWSWVRSLLDVGAFDNSFTIDPAAYRPIATNSDNSVQYDYDGDDGDTLRFGDSVFGANPDDGMVFTVTYRFGAGAAGNVAAGAINRIDPASPAAGGLQTVMNPLGATGGADRQSLQSIQRLAPQAFRDRKRRAVLAQDYAAAAETLPWVKSAGASFRWTGSWLTTFTTPEPKATEQIPIGYRTDLITLLNRYRMAGTESYVPDPDYVSMDLQIEVCAQASAFAAGVKAAIVQALSPVGPGAASAFFAVNRFVFGQALERSQLEAAIQNVPGVAGVTCIRYRLRDMFAGFQAMGDTVPVGASQILRCDNDPSRPNNGALAVTVGGGR